jgi:hypothetical protein
MMDPFFFAPSNRVYSVAVDVWGAAAGKAAALSGDEVDTTMAPGK